MVGNSRARRARVGRLLGALIGAEVALFTKDPTALPGWDHERPGMVFDSIEELVEANYPGYERIKLGPSPTFDGGTVRWPEVTFSRSGGQGGETCWVIGWLVLDRAGNVIAGLVPQMVQIADYDGSSIWMSAATAMAPGSSLTVQPEFRAEGL